MTKAKTPEPVPTVPAPVRFIRASEIAKKHNVSKYYVMKIASKDPAFPRPVRLGNLLTFPVAPVEAFFRALQETAIAPIVRPVPESLRPVVEARRKARKAKAAAEAKAAKAAADQAEA